MAAGRVPIGEDSLGQTWEVLGSGGFGWVCKATHKLLGIEVAIKLPNDDSSEIYADLCREAGYMKDADQFAPRFYGMYRGRTPITGSREMKGIVMELMEGGCLESFLRNKTKYKPPPWPLAFRLAHQVALAMDFLHCKMNLVHMDLKPANVLLDFDFNAKIADFGLSTVTNTVMETKGENKGCTQFYAPPESFKELYHRTRSYDVYSYGILLWTILTGEKYPYPGVDKTRFGVLIKHRPDQTRPDLDKIDVQKAAGLDELVELIQRCWDSKPNKRPSFAECVKVTRGVFSRHKEGISAACASCHHIGDDSLEDWEYLGGGGFGVFCKATHKLLGIKVAIKLLNDSSEESYDDLCREADIMKDADQFVPRFYGMYRGRTPMTGSKEMQGIVIELMEGGSLVSFLRNKTQSKPPPWPLAFRLAHQVALAMDFLHVEKNLVHMDLKPANILLDADLNAKITDFGLSTVTNSVMLTNGENKGVTAYYAPPEYFKEPFHRHRSFDVYSYGILLWTILTGEKCPYPGVDKNLLKFHMKTKPDQTRPDLGKIDVQKAAGLEELVELMQRCWDSKPNKRPSFAECVEVTRGVFSRHEEGISAACDLLNLPVPAPPECVEVTRGVFSRHEEGISAACDLLNLPVPAPPDHVRGHHIGDDSLEDWEYIGSGGFAYVFMATHKLLGIKVAIKLLKYDSDGRLYAELCREADRLKDADQFAPRFYGMYRGRTPITGSKEMHGIVMELMEGGCLESFLRNKTQSKPPPWPLAFRLAHQVALAMDFLHGEMKLVHMNLKPADVLLDADFNAKITDFGLSTVTNSVMSTRGENKGWTLSYAPPEAFKEPYHRVRSFDVYSYGILLWTILTGETVFYVGVGRSLLEFHMKTRPDQTRPDLGIIDVQKAAGLEELVELMQRCWDSKPNKRPSFAECVEVTRGVFSRHEEGISAACDLLNPPPPVPAPPGAPGLTDREAFLKRSSLSLDPNTASRNLLLSENNRMVTGTDEDQPYADNPLRYTCYPNVLSNECISDTTTYFEVKWSGEWFGIAVCQDDVNRKDMGLSYFGAAPQSWMLYYSDSMKRYVFCHNSIVTEVSGPVPSTGGSHRVGVYVDAPAGVLCFYVVCGNTMSLLHTERTTFTRPLYAGICVYRAAKAEVEVLRSIVV